MWSQQINVIIAHHGAKQVWEEQTGEISSFQCDILLQLTHTWCLTYLKYFILFTTRYIYILLDTHLIVYIYLHQYKSSVEQQFGRGTEYYSVVVVRNLKIVLKNALVMVNRKPITKSTRLYIFYFIEA